MFGGVWEKIPFNDMWAFDLKANAWRALLSTSAYTLSQHSMVFMPACQSLIIAGGVDASNAVNSATLAFRVGACAIGA